MVSLGVTRYGCWREDLSEEAFAVRARIKADKRLDPNRIDEHFGRLFKIGVEKGSELPVGHKDRKWKGRVVFQGSAVLNQNFEIAVFSEMASQPATLESSACADAYGCLLGGQPTWVRLPKHQWPQKWIDDGL